MALRGFCAPELLASLLGLWSHVLLFRRPVLAVLSAMFRDSRREPATQLFPLDPEAQPVVRELWRHAEAKGYYTKLDGVAASILKELELDPLDPADQPVLPVVEPVPLFPVPPCLQEGLLYDVVELFAGSGNWTQAHKEQGLSAHPGVDIQGARLRYMDMAPADQVTALHNLLARGMAFLFCLVSLRGGFFLVEQPGGSVMFYMACFVRLAMLGAVLTRCTSCSFGSPFCKPFQWLHNKPWLTELAGTCTCEWRGAHLVIGGSFSPEVLSTFHSRCRPSAKRVFGGARSPVSLLLLSPPATPCL